MDTRIITNYHAINPDGLSLGSFGKLGRCVDFLEECRAQGGMIGVHTIVRMDTKIVNNVYQGTSSKAIAHYNPLYHTLRTRVLSIDMGQ